jgi:serine/threonine protein kinase
MTNVGNYQLKLDPEPIGSGAYGSVYVATDAKGNKYAVKRIQMGKHGLENILEPIIMSSLRHKHLAHALSILATKKYLYILGDLADADMAQITRLSNRKKRSTPITEDQILNWCFQIALAVYCLHSNHIVHGDLKATNCLLFNKDSKYGCVKICDYSLSSYVTGKKCMGVVGTSTHRAPEVFARLPWSYGVDIWACACTFYEIAYGVSLFPFQGDQPKIHRDAAAIACLKEFGERHTLGPQSFQLPSVTDITFQKAYTGQRKPIPLLDKLILSMLTQESKRPTIIQILQNPYFSKLTGSIPKVINRTDNLDFTFNITGSATSIWEDSTRENTGAGPALRYSILSYSNMLKLDVSEDSYVRQGIAKYTTDPITVDYALELYRLSKNIKLPINLDTLAYVAHKILHRATRLGNIKETASLYAGERQFCAALSYYFHFPDIFTPTGCSDQRLGHSHKVTVGA